MIYAKMIVYDDNVTNGNAVSNKEGNQKDKVVPHIDYVFSGDRMSYRKVAVKSAKQFDKEVENNACAIMSSIPIDTTKDDILSQEVDFEMIVLEIHDDWLQRHRAYVSAADTALFIMNRDGKTIDRLSCRNQH